MLTFGSLLLTFLAASGVAAQQRRCTTVGDLEIVTFASKVFPAPRSLRVLLPAGYRLPGSHDRRYPVLYMNDGQNLFDVCTTMYGGEEWRLDETVEELTAQGKIKPMIVVGIDNGGRRLRPKEYLPYVDDTLTPREPNPEGRLYPGFLLDEVVPFVERHYRVVPGARHRVLGGSSYGAGIALYAAIKRPRAFEGLLLESPSIYAEDYRLLKEAADTRTWPRRIYIGTGTVQEPVADVRKLEALLQKAGLGRDRLYVVVREGAAHSEKWWAERLPDALQFLFSSPM
ncbi:MAG TPA: alpha/beta hydrolase-fold protein [Candidatus Acidoferrales bacterium]|jgi:enterochelin esterase-like enzyme|nr:alpha/beta hydrolase-fold protein [Candidatus Acidoferrales bacterium]